MIKIWIEEPKGGLGGSAQITLPTAIEAGMLTGAIEDGIRILDSLGVLSDYNLDLLLWRINELAWAEDAFEGEYDVKIRYKVTGKDELALLRKLKQYAW